MRGGSILFLARINFFQFFGPAKGGIGGRFRLGFGRTDFEDSDEHHGEEIVSAFNTSGARKLARWQPSPDGRI
jgi:hypothetical protein